jgi:hypothetical protein
MNQVVLPETPIHAQANIVPGWAWREHSGKLTRPSAMRTGHLFNTLKMIWNNRMPEQCRVGEFVRLYSFGPNYPDEYLAHAVYEMA